MLQFILETEFIQRGIVAAIVAAFICPLIGTFLAVRRLSMVSEALSHMTLSGVGVGLVLVHWLVWEWLNPLYVGLVFAVMGAIFIEQLRKLYRQYEEISIPMVLTIGVGFGVVLMGLANGFNAGLLHLLFGSIVSVSRADLTFILVTGCIVLVIIGLIYKELLSLSFDEEFSKTSGIPVKRLNLLFAILIAFTIAIAMRVVGILLVTALITLPVAAALKLGKSFKQVLIWSVIIAQSAMLSGIVVGYYLEIATGGMVVMMALVHLVLVLLIQRIRQKAVSRRIGHEG